MKYSEYQKKLMNNAEYQEAVKKLNYLFALGDAVLGARLKKGWSQTELARRAGTKQANISRIEAGMGNPTLDLIKRLCDELDVEINFQTRSKEISREVVFNAYQIFFEVLSKENSSKLFEIQKVFTEYIKECKYSYDTKSRKDIIDNKPILVENWPRKIIESSPIPETYLSTDEKED